MRLLDWAIFLVFPPWLLIVLIQNRYASREAIEEYDLNRSEV